MTYAVTITMDQPVQTYDAIHTELLQSLTGPIEGLLLHIGRAAGDGFQVIEVWESREHADRYNRELVWPIIARIGGSTALAAQPVVEEFEVRGLVIPPAGVAW